MQAYKEITTWPDGATAVNHTYLLEGDKMLAYIRQGTNIPFHFARPITISRSGRKFELVEPNPFEHMFSVVVPQVIVNTREISGSKGAKYILDLDLKTCTCPGYTYRGACKHVKDMDNEN
jgi:hypothetical protein